MTNYFYDAKTHEYLTSAPAQIHPRTGEALPALLSTHTPPPETGEKEKAVWNGEAWEVVEDHRQHVNSQGVKEGGTPYWLPGDTTHSAARYMEDLGPLPEEARLAPPPPSLTETASAKRREIARGHEEAIVATMTMPSASPGQKRNLRLRRRPKPEMTKSAKPPPSPQSTPLKSPTPCKEPSS